MKRLFEACLILALVAFGCGDDDPTPMETPPCAVCQDPRKPYCDASPDAGMPASDPSECRECLSDEHCESGAYCTAAGECGECTNDTHCSGRRDFCHVETATCEACVTNDDCPSEKPSCDPTSFTCFSCDTAADCGGEGFVCDNGRCEGCETNKLNCDGLSANKCEAYLTDNNNCGGCGIVCEGDSYCTSQGCMNGAIETLHSLSQGSFELFATDIDGRWATTVVTTKFSDKLESILHNGIDFPIRAYDLTVKGTLWKPTQASVAGLVFADGSLYALETFRMKHSNKEQFSTAVIEWPTDRVVEEPGEFPRNHLFWKPIDAKELNFCPAIPISGGNLFIWEESEIIPSAPIQKARRCRDQSKTMLSTIAFDLDFTPAPEESYSKAETLSGDTESSTCVRTVPRGRSNDWILCVETEPHTTQLHRLPSEDGLVFWTHSSGFPLRIDGHLVRPASGANSIFIFRVAETTGLVSWVKKIVPEASSATSIEPLLIRNDNDILLGYSTSKDLLLKLIDIDSNKVKFESTVSFTSAPIWATSTRDAGITRYTVGGRKQLIRLTETPAP